MKKLVLLSLTTVLFSCNGTDEKADGYGNFEATEVTISAEAIGKIEFLTIEEGDIHHREDAINLLVKYEMHTYAER